VRRLGIGLIGFGWLGKAHSRSMLRIRTLFGEREFDPVLVACSDAVPAKVEEAVRDFGYARGAADWHEVVDAPDVDVVVIAAPNALHLEMIEAAAAAGKHVFCEKPVGASPEETVRAHAAAQDVITGVGYNYRWAPLIRYAAGLIRDGELGELTNYRGRFFSMYGSDPLGVLSWRFQEGLGVTSDLLSHAVDLAHMLAGPIARVVGTTATFIPERPLGNGSHYGRGRPGDPHGPVVNEDYAAMLVEFENGARGSFEASRTMIGPESQMAFDVHGTRGALGWNLERLNELQLYRVTDDPGSGYTTVFGGERFPHHGRFAPGSANGIGYEDLVTIEDYEFCASVASGRPHTPSFADAVRWVAVQSALLQSARTGRWEEVAPV
jgi:predicted dehydrogenase